MSDKAGKKKKKSSKAGVSSKSKKISAPHSSSEQELGADNSSPSSKGDESKRSPDFEAGQLFERMIADGSASVSRSDFMKLYEKMRNTTRGGQFRETAGDFEAGRIFERYDTERSGKISKGDFVHLMNDLNRNQRFGIGGYFGSRFPLERRELNLSPSLSTRRRYDDYMGHPSGRPDVAYNHRSRRGAYLDDSLNLPTATSGRMFGPPRDHFLNGYASSSTVPTVPLTMGAGIATMGSSEVTSLYHRMTHQMETKIAALAEQHRAVQARILDVQRACESCEQETEEVFRPIVERIRVYESRTLASLQRDQDLLREEADILEGLIDRVKSSNGHYQELLRLIPSVNEVVARPYKRHFDEPTIRPPREALELTRAMEDSDSASSALRAKDHMIWKLLNERKEDKEQVSIAQNESATVNARSAREVAKWKEMSNEFLDKLESCEIRLRRNNDELIDQKSTLRRVANLLANDDFDEAKRVVANWQEDQRRVSDDRRRDRADAAAKKSDARGVVHSLRRQGSVDLVTSDLDGASDGGSVGLNEKSPRRVRGHFRELRSNRRSN